MNKIRRITFKILAIVLFLLAIASVLATLFAAPTTGRSPGVFLAVVLAGFGRWLLGKNQGQSVQETFGRAVDVVEMHDGEAKG